MPTALSRFPVTFARLGEVRAEASPGKGAKVEYSGRAFPANLRPLFGAPG